jgi:predicted MFS family arabinose efflux permease
MESPKPPTGMEASSFRWFVLSILFAVQLLIQSSLYGPAAAAVQIRQHLAITNAQFGFAMGAANFATTFAVIPSSVLIDRIGVAKTFAWGLAILGFGGVENFFAQQFSILMAARISEGLAIGIIYPAAAALIMGWFPAGELPYVNTGFIVFAFVGSGAAYVATAAMLRTGISWTGSLAVYGVVSLLVCVLWTVIGRENGREQAQTLGARAPDMRESSLRQAIRMPVIWLLGVGLFAARAVSEMYLFFLPMYLQKERRIAQGEAAHLSSLLPFASVVGVLIFGFLARNVALRKHLLWISAALVLVGSLAIPFNSDGALKLGLVIVGCGVAGIQPVQSTYVMSLPRVTPSIVAAFFVITNLLTHIGGFVTPAAAGRLSETSLGLKDTLLLFSLLEVAGVVALLLVPSSKVRQRTDSMGESCDLDA